MHLIKLWNRKEAWSVVFISGGLAVSAIHPGKLVIMKLIVFLGKSSLLEFNTTINKSPLYPDFAGNEDAYKVCEEEKVQKRFPMSWLKDFHLHHLHTLSKDDNTSTGA